MTPHLRRVVLWLVGHAQFRGGSGVRDSKGCEVTMLPPEDRTITWPAQPRIAISAINSQGKSGSTYIEIPIDAIPELIGVLLDAHQAILNEDCKVFELKPVGVAE